MFVGPPPEVQYNASDHKPSSETDSKGLDEYIDQYKGMGYRQVKDINSEGSRTLAFRKLEMGEPMEVIIVQSGSDIDITKTVNGKKVDPQ